ncbi:MAG TPA: hypothetical protein VEA78_12275 [Acidimicrobiales bacterium]|nr:hypothetical protein [Acidimicrobiales bacterium]
MSFDDIVERWGRKAAARTTRRTFLGRVGKAAVLVAGGPALATLLVERAEARVCGQSGVAPKCPTFDCTFPDSVWGWCWYASPGCCADGGLKKICDCCTLNYPFVHGYCPSGYNVRCIVESCWADPRVMDKAVLRAGGLSHAQVALAVSRNRPHGSGGHLVIGDADDAKAGAIAGPIASHLAGALLFSGKGRLAGSVIAEAQRLKATHATFVGRFPESHLEELRSYGLTVDTAGTTSLDVARWLIARTGGTQAMCIESTGVSVASAAAAAAAAGQLRVPLVVGIDNARALAARRTWLVGPEATRRAGEVPGAIAVGGGTVEDVAVSLATLVVDRGATGITVHVAPASQSATAVGLSGNGGVVLFHPDGALGNAVYGWILNHRAAIARSVAGGTLGSLGDGGLYDLQSALHQFETHRLQGVPGQGLPVISQPRDERDIGRARIAGDVAPEAKSYWSGRARR